MCRFGFLPSLQTWKQFMWKIKNVRKDKLKIELPSFGEKLL